MSELEHALDIARSEIDRICGLFEVRVVEASGPAFDKKVLRLLNADHTH